MNKLSLTLFACVVLASCDAKQSVDNPVSIPDAELTGNRGQVLSTIDVERYTYIEVRSNGQEVWLVGPPVDVNEGDVIRWGDFAVMRDFTSSELNRTFDTVLFVAAVSRDSQESAGDARASGDVNSGVVRSTADAAGYTYVELAVGDERTMWLATPAIELSVGDHVSWTGGSLMTDFRSNSLDKVFPEILFVQTLTTMEGG